VFTDAAATMTPEEIRGMWAIIKAEEKAERAAQRGIAAEKPQSLLADVKPGQPALVRALALQAIAGTVGFDWNDPHAVLAKIREEADEIEAALHAGDAAQAGDEVGDLLFTVVNLARHLRVDPEGTLRAANAKFERRFAFIERALAAQGKALAATSLAEMDALWNAAKDTERESGR
jgi:ATP diphosphatase